MNEYDNVFGNIMRAKPVSQFSTRLPRGTHQLILKQYKPKASTNPLKPGTILEVDFMVASSNAQGVVPGETRGWSWMLDAPGYRGPAEQARAKDFINNVLESVSGIPGPLTFRDATGNPYWYQTDEAGRFTTNPPTPLQEHNTLSIGALLNAGYFIGLSLGCECTPAMKNGVPIMTQKNEPINNAAWTVPSQTMDQIAAMRSQLAAIAAAAPPPPVAPQQPNHAPQQQYGGAPQQPQYAPQQQAPQYAPAPAPVPQQSQYAPQPAPQQYAPAPQPAALPQFQPAPQQQQAPQYAPAPQPAPGLAPGPVVGAGGPLSNILANMRNNGQG